MWARGEAQELGWWAVKHLSLISPEAVLPHMVEWEISFFSDYFEYYFQFPHIANISSCSLFGLVLGCRGKPFCVQQRRGTQVVCFVNEVFCEIKKPTTLPFTYSLFFFPDHQFIAFLCSLWQEHLGHQSRVQSDINSESVGLRPTQSPFWDKCPAQHWLLGDGRGFTSWNPVCVCFLPCTH